MRARHVTCDARDSLQGRIRAQGDLDDGKPRFDEGFGQRHRRSGIVENDHGDEGNGA
jgi:hypothetical protein